jgi:hypothetical protein
MEKNDGEFIPAPSVWLNKKQWENDYWMQKNHSTEVAVDPAVDVSQAREVRW